MPGTEHRGKQWRQSRIGRQSHVYLQPSLESSGKPQDNSSRKGADSHHVFYEDDTYWYFFFKDYMYL